MIKIKNLDISYGSESLVKKEIIEMLPSRLIGLYGKSGCGKTSFLNFLNMENQFGDLVINDLDVYQLSDQEQVNYRYQHITYLSQNHTFIPGLNCFDILDFAILASNSKYTKEELLEKVGISIINSTTTIKSLSMGQRALFSLAYAIAKDDQILLLDEIFSSLDHQTVIRIIKLLKELALQGKYVICAFHNDIYQEYFDELLIFENNTINIVEKRENPIVDHTKETKKEVNLKLLKKSFLHYHLTTSIFQMALLSFFVAVAVIIYMNSHSLFQHIEHIEKMINRTHYSLVRDEHAGSISPTRLRGIDSDKIQQIKDLEDIEKVVPGIMYSISPYYTSSNGSHELDRNIYHVQVNGIEQRIDSFNEGEGVEYTIYPYIDQYLDQMCKGKINPEGNFYLYEDIAQKLGITTLDEEQEITLSVLIPTGCRENDIVGYDSNIGEFSRIEQENFNAKQEITVKVRGILDVYYPMEYPNIIGYLPQGIMYETYLNNLNERSNYSIQEYLVEAKENTTPKEIKAQIKAIDEDIDVNMNGEDTLEYWNQTLKNNDQFIVYVYCLVFVCLVVAIVVGWINYRVNDQYFKILTKQGISAKEIKKIRIYKIVVTSLMHLGLTALLTVIIEKYLLTEIIFVNTISSEFNRIIIYSVLSSLIILLIMNAPNLFTLEKKKYDL